MICDNRKIVITTKGRVLLSKLREVLALLHEPENNPSERIRRVLSKLKIMYKVRENYVVKGKSGLLHVFDYFIDDEIKLAIKVGKGDPVEFLSFMVSLVDTNNKGVYIDVNYESAVSLISNYFSPCNSSVIILQDPQDLLSFLLRGEY